MTSIKLHQNNIPFGSPENKHRVSAQQMSVRRIKMRWMRGIGLGLHLHVEKSIVSSLLTVPDPKYE